MTWFDLRKLWLLLELLLDLDEVAVSDGWFQAVQCLFLPSLVKEEMQFVRLALMRAMTWPTAGPPYYISFGTVFFI